MRKLFAIFLVWITLVYYPLVVYAATSPWVQSNWVGGSGQTSWATTNKYSSASNATTSTSNQITLATEEKLLNTSFDADLSNWSEVPNYTLNDQFTTAKTSAELTPDTTSAEPTGGLRTVTDTNGKISINPAGTLNFATGEAQYDGLWYSSLARTAGKTLLGTITPANTSNSTRFGWDSDTSGSLLDSINFGSTGNISFISNGGSVTTLGTYSAAAYQVALVMRASGMFWYIKSGTEYPNWTLVWTSSLGSGAGIPALESSSTTSVFTADNIRISTALWLPTPLASDGFSGATTDGLGHAEGVAGGLGVGGSGLTRTGGTAASGTLTITPTLSDELWDAPAAAFTSGTYAWTAYGTNTIANVSNALQITYVDNTEGVYDYLRDISDLSSNLTIGQWYSASVDSSINTGSANLHFGDGSGGAAFSVPITSTSPTTTHLTNRATSATLATLRGRNMSSGEILTLDNISLKPLTLSSLFSTVPTSNADVIADVTISSATAGTQAGLVLNLDSTSNPQNFIIVYHDGTNLKVEEMVGGVYNVTAKQSTAVALGAGALRVIRDGTKLRVYLNNVLIGAELTMTANTNTTHGLFSTYASNSFDNFVVWPRNTGFSDAPFEELTATRDITTKYTGAASVKLVAGGTDGNYTQNVSADTNTYNLSAYAYTGAPVTTNDLNLYYDTGTITTTFTPVDGANLNGWYKLTGTLTGSASSKAYGVRVKAGKTVYIDDMSLNRYATTGTVTSSIFDSGTAAQWGTLTYSATTPTNTSVSVKARSGLTSDLSSATAFDSCIAISSGSALSSGGCVTNGQRYIQYLVTLATTDALTTPTFSSLSIPFSSYSLTPSADSPSDNSYTSNERPTFRWKAASDANTYLSSYSVVVDNGDQDFSLTNIPVNQTSDYDTDMINAHFDGFGDSDGTNNYIGARTKSSNQWAQNQHDGVLLEGKRIWTISGHDNNSGGYSVSRTLFVDRTAPKVAIGQVNDTAATDIMATNDTTPTLYGTITDSLAGDSDTTKVASGPKSVTVKIEKQNVFGAYDLTSLSTTTLGTIYTSADGSEITDNTKNTSDKYSTFAYTPETPQASGKYRISVSGTDTADNSGTSTSLLVTVGSLDEVATAEQKKLIDEELQGLPKETQEMIKKELVVTAPATTPSDSFARKLRLSVLTFMVEAYWRVVGIVSHGVSLLGNALHTVSSATTLIADNATAMLHQLNTSLISLGRQTSAFISSHIPSITEPLVQLERHGQDYFASQIRLSKNIKFPSIPNPIPEAVQQARAFISSQAYLVSSAAQSIQSSVMTTESKLLLSLQKSSRALFVRVQKFADKASNFAQITAEYWFDREPTKISNVKIVAISATSAVITWKTNHHATGAVNYGVTRSYGNKVEITQRVKNHEVTLHNLTPGSMYYFEVMSQGKNYVYDAYYTFETLK